MRWRLTSAECSRSTKGSRIATLDTLVEAKAHVGVLALLAGKPVGWVAVVPRQALGALERYRALPRVDAQPAWAVTCYFLDRQMRHQGATLDLLDAGVYARSQGAAIIEGNPVAPGARLYTYMGAPAIFRQAGFVDVTPAGRERLVMRYTAGCAVGAGGCGYIQSDP